MVVEVQMQPMPEQRTGVELVIAWMAGFEESSWAASALIGERSGSDAVKRNAYGGKDLSQYGPLELPQCILPQARRAAYRRK
jgi:hypothetical protein